MEYVRTVVHRAAEGINWPAKAVSRSVYPARIGIYTHPLVSELFAGSLLIVVCGRRGRRGLVGVSCVVSSWRFFCSAEGFARHGYHSHDQTSITCNMIFHFLLHKVQITSPVLYGEKNESQKSEVKKRSGKKSEKKEVKKKVEKKVEKEVEEKGQNPAYGQQQILLVQKEQVS